MTIKEIINAIESGKTFKATADDGSFNLKVDRYVPYVCTAIHDGSNLRTELNTKIALSDYERWYEEDPHTADFITSMPISFDTLTAFLKLMRKLCIYSKHLYFEVVFCIKSCCFF